MQEKFMCLKKKKKKTYSGSFETASIGYMRKV